MRSKTRPNSPVLFCVGAWIVATTAGCGSGPAQPSTVHGAVFYRGGPVPGGTIVFTPDPTHGGSGPFVRAETKPDGTYVLTGSAPPGWYRVTIMAVETPPIGYGAPLPGLPRSLVPERYRDPELSKLSCEIKAGLDNKIDFNLE